MNHSTPNFPRIGRRLLAGMTAAGLMLGLAAPASAATFGVRVLDAEGVPVAGASVCFGLEGNHKQFAAMFTNDEGIATATVPNVPLVVTVSKTRFSGVRVQEPARGFNLIKDMTLVEGVPGPRCRADSALADAAGSMLRIRDVDVSDDGDVMTLRADATGEPTHYRVATDRDFTGANWQRYDAAIPVDSQLAAASELFLQLRRFAGDATASLEMRSDVSVIALTKVLQ